ncbi:MAG: glycosyltransferase family 2 protein [Lachnospiraceae bacterium]|nr:glycosyltransferase family 2 protein [Lachnospiraceae bacterium]
MSDIKVSVIIPVYNVDKYLKQCLDSLVNQTLKDIEIICVDDGSTDGSLAILKEYADKYDTVQVIEQQNAGAGAARNNGLKIAKGEYLSFLDSDDFFEPDMLEVAYNKAVEDKADMVVFKSDQYYEDNDEFKQVTWTLRYPKIPPYMPFKHRQMTDNVFKVFVGWAWDKLFKTEFVKEHNLLFQEQRTSNDMLFVFSATVLAQRITVVPQDKVLAHQRRNNSTSLSNTREKSWQCFYNALNALKKRLEDEGMFKELEQDYVNYALHFSLWNLNTVAEPTHTMLKDKLCSEWFEELGIKGREDTYFYDKKEYGQYKELMQ